MDKIIAYLLNLAISVDKLVNSVFGGSHAESISAAAWRLGEVRRWRRWHYARLFIDALFFWQKSKDGRRHCQQAFDNELARSALAKEYHTKDA